MLAINKDESFSTGKKIKFFTFSKIFLAKAPVRKKIEDLMTKKQ